jgi:hypothetical protein
MSGIAAEETATRPFDQQEKAQHPAAEVAFWLLLLVVQLTWIAGLVYLGVHFL